jgi:hypothetical protein
MVRAEPGEWEGNFRLVIGVSAAPSGSLTAEAMGYQTPEAGPAEGLEVITRIFNQLGAARRPDLGRRPQQH